MKKISGPCFAVSIDDKIEDIMNQYPESRSLFNRLDITGCYKIRNLPCSPQDRDRLLLDLLEIIKSNGAPN